jgi:two-component system, cell cycle sensor histidine kinase and response regulator CckA
MLPRRINLNDVLANIDHLLRALLGRDIELRIDTRDAVLDVKADPGQIEQVVMNIASNTRDAMPSGGRLTIGTEAVDLDGAAAAPFPGLQPGRYVRLTMADTGHGMPEAVRAHVFESFFTTKDQGQGTGLGLSTAYGIIKQSGGWIYVDSAPDIGTTFTIYLPQVRDEHHAEEHTASDRHVILVVEDDDAVRHLTGQSLRRHGHVVFEARTITDGAAIASERPIDLVICDVRLPDGDGQQLVRRLRERAPDLRVLYLAGYGEIGLGPGGIAPHEAVLEKPFAPPALASAVQDVMTPTSSL